MSQKSPYENTEENLAEQLSSLLTDPQAIKDAAEKAAVAVKDYVKKHPLQTLALALGLGLVAGLLISKKNKS